MGNHLFFDVKVLEIGHSESSIEVVIDWDEVSDVSSHENHGDDADNKVENWSNGVPDEHTKANSEILINEHEEVLYETINEKGNEVNNFEEVFHHSEENEIDNLEDSGVEMVHGIKFGFIVFLGEAFLENVSLLNHVLDGSVDWAVFLSFLNEHHKGVGDWAHFLVLNI